VAFREKIKKYENEEVTIVYLDESGFAYDMPRLYGYSIIGERCFCKQDWHARGRTNVIGAIIRKEIITTCLFDTYINSDIFYAWLTQDLLPKLPPNSVIVMDNASFHKRLDMINAIENAGHIIEYLPPYSPDLNPIEHKWHQAKAKRRELHCSVSNLFAFHSL